MKDKNNPFKHIEQKTKAPEEMKDVVMKNAAKAKLLKDLSSLFTDNYAESLKQLFNTDQ